MSYATVASLREYLPQVPEFGQQLITVTGTPFVLTYDGSATAGLASTATATTVQTALRGITAIGSSGVNVRGRPGGPFTATFQGTLATDAALLEGTNATVVPATDSLLQAVLDRATAMIDSELGYSFGTGAAGSQIVYGDGTDYLSMPAYTAGSVTAVTAPSGYTVPEYVEQDGALVITRGGRIGMPRYGAVYVTDPIYEVSYPLTGWLAGLPYTVSATFGYTAVPDDIVEACLEIAVDLWRFRDAGSIKAIGVEGAGVVSGKGLPATAAQILSRYRETTVRIY